MAQIIQIFVLINMFWTTVPLLTASQETNVPIIETSTPMSPMLISGDVSLSEVISGPDLTWSFRGTIQGRNISDKTILTMIVWIDFQTSYGQREHHVKQYECFFAPDVIQPGDVHVFEDTSRHGPAMRTEPVGLSPARSSPKAEIKIVYVEFLDGSEYGDSSAAKNILRLRQAAWHELKRLDREYRTHGEEAFLQALKEPVDSYEVNTFIDSIRRTQMKFGTISAIRQIEGMLAWANKRKHLNKFQ